MKRVPETSTTLLRDIACDSLHARWGEFVARCRPMMDAYMRTKFPTLDADKVVLQTLIALIRTMPVYHYDPEEKGSFHAYLIGQLAKNYAVEGGKLISGRDLVGFIIEQIRGIRDQVGGKVVFLEYEKDRPKLKEFYKSCAFEEFKMPSDAEDGERLGQLFCFLNEKTSGGNVIGS